MKSFKQLISEMMTSTGGGVAGMHLGVTPTDGLPQIAGREADRLAIRPRRKKKKKDEVVTESPLTDTFDKHDNPLSMAADVTKQRKQGKIKINPDKEGVGKYREIIKAFLKYKKRKSK
jgi:hypothetical protein